MEMVTHTRNGRVGLTEELEVSIDADSHEAVEGQEFGQAQDTDMKVMANGSS